jgi:hypothetical protein
MTLPEIAVLCSDVNDKPEVTSEADLHAYARWWQALTPEERLWAEA